jgi:hypothetical protein
MTHPSVSKDKAFGFLLLAGFLLVVGLATYFFMRPTPTEKTTVNRPAGQTMGDAKYEDLIKREMATAAEDTRRAQREHSASVKRLISIHASKADSIADQAADRASEFATLTKTIYYLAQDQVTGGKETDRYLQEKIGPTVEPDLQSLAREVNAGIAAFDVEVRRITVQLATNIASIGPGTQPAPPRVVPPAMIGPEFNRIIAERGGKFADIAVEIGLDVVPKAIPKTMIMKLSQMCARIALRLFGKQVAKLVGSAVIGTATGPFEIVVLAGAVIWTGYDVWQARIGYRDEVRATMKNQLDSVDR